MLRGKTSQEMALNGYGVNLNNVRIKNHQKSLREITIYMKTGLFWSKFGLIAASH